MSVVVAVKKDNIVYMGCDSQVTRGGTRSTLSNPNNYKIWKVKGVDNCIIGHVGHVRDANAIRVINDLIHDLAVYKNDINFDYVVTYIVPRIFSELKKYQYYKDEAPIENIDSRFLFAYKDKLFLICNDLSVIEIDDMIAIGSGECEAIGSMITNNSEDPEDIIIKAIKASAAHDLYVDYPIIVTNSKDCEFKVIFENNNGVNQNG